MRAAIVAGALALSGCVPNAYVYDDLPSVSYGSSGAPYPPAYYYGYPGYSGDYRYPGYYGHPRYYSYAPYPPRVVYYDHDHRGDDCRHESHRNGDRHDRSPPDGSRVGPPATRPPPPRNVDTKAPGSPPQAPPARNPCGGKKKCGPPATPAGAAAPQGTRGLRVSESDDRDKKPGARTELD